MLKPENETSTGQSEHPSAFRLFLIAAFAIFTAEAVVMLVLPVFPPLTTYIEAIIDASMLSVVVLAVLYFFLYRPMVQNITKRKQVEEELRLIASTDALTGVLNRRAGIQLLEHHMLLSARSKKSLCVCFADIDGLKGVNDIFGHSEGDEMIRIATKVMKASIRESDSVCRLGGDEFLLIFPLCSLAEAAAIWKRIEARLYNAKSEFKKPYSICISHGIVEYDPEKGRKIPEEVLKAADQEMYKNKQCSTD